MTWRLAIEHHSGYRYVSDVVASYNEVRVTPMTTSDQLVLDPRVLVTPHTRTRRYVDYWATVVDAFDVHDPHTEMTVVARSMVETNRPVVDPPEIAWSELRDPIVRDRWCEFLTLTRFVDSDERIEDAAATLRLSEEGAVSPTDAVLATVAWTRRSLEYAPGRTGVHTSATEALSGGSGVCQDFAHVTIAVLRTMGIPA